MRFHSSLFLLKKSQKKPSSFNFRSYAEEVCTKTFKIPNNKFALRLYGSYKAIGMGVYTVVLIVWHYCSGIYSPNWEKERSRQGEISGLIIHPYSNFRCNNDTLVAIWFYIQILLGSNIIGIFDSNHGCHSCGNCIFQRSNDNSRRMDVLQSIPWLLVPHRYNY